MADQPTESGFVQRPADSHRLEFFAWETIGGGPEEGAELKALAERLRLKTDADKYRDLQGVDYQESTVEGYTVLPVLPDLWGMPLNDLVMAYVASLRPSCVRVSRGTVTLNARKWRVTIFVDAEDKVERIEQEVGVGYGSGDEVGRCLRAAKAGAEPRAGSGCVGNTASLARVDLQ
jgi:hypothetical protein